MSDSSQRQNVVEFRPAAKLKRSQSAVRLPAAVHLLKEKTTYFLQSAMLALFDSADDTLFELADKSDTNQDQSLYFESMRQVRLCRREIENSLIERVHAGFDRLADPHAVGHEEWEYQVDTDNLSLVNNEQLEQNVAVESMVNKAIEANPESLQHLTLRLDSLVPCKVYQRNNPVGPHDICYAFLKAAESLDTNIKVKLVVLKLFERHVMNELPGFYDLANELMIQRNILPSLTTNASRQRGNPAESSTGAATRAPGSQEVLQTFRSLVGEGALPGQENSAGEQQVVISESTLLQLLSQVQVQQMRNPQVTTAGIDVQQLQNILTAQHKGVIGQIDRDVINLINLLFEFIVDDRNLAAEMKVLLSRLQIPLLKVAIADKTFFDHGGHPAKRLLNEMATASLGWVANQKGRDNLYSKVEQTVLRICEDPNVGTEVFDEMLMDFLSFIEKEKRQAAILEKRTLDAEAGKAKAEAARSEVSSALAKLKNVDNLSDPMKTLVHEAWANVMFLVALKDGVDSPQWNSAHSTVRNLVWSLTTEVTSENRVRLIKLLPELLKRLRTGLESISFNAYDMGKLFKHLEAEHLAQLRGKPASAQANATVPATPDVATKVQPRPLMPRGTTTDAAPEKPAGSPVATSSVEPRLPSRGETTPAAPAAVEPEPQFLDQVDGLSQGSWFELRSSGEASVRCRLAAIIKPTGKYIFVNRSGMKVAEKDRNELAINLRSGEIRMLDNSMLFDRALESVISNLRDSRSPTNR
ncbi:DUF1631 domain-containing protein [Halioxenophilus sp. WMMB6]|uniref:DUF1631 domain-containing protein n=1 Tax=Halioxenophilus sp. WMMB6 TaxID=3073815 RepID=UPI00295ED2A9|nr:DUF1631 domain-containing protein [Halioxenophilus sp. WMMB6]